MTSGCYFSKVENKISRSMYIEMPINSEGNTFKLEMRQKFLFNRPQVKLIQFKIGLFV